MPQFETLIFENLNGLAHISLNRPQVLNAYNIQMRDDFSQALSAVAEDPGVGALLISGQGRAFCAGADLTEFGTAPSQVVARHVRWERDVWGQLLNLKQPVVCAVHGYCIGSGLEIALFCDLRLAARSTKFAMPEVQLGMIPAAGGTQTLPRNAGWSQALELLLTGRRIDADEALALGLISRVVEDEELPQAGFHLAQILASGDNSALISAKAAIGQGLDLALAQGLALEKRLSARLLGLTVLN
ncbi:MAG: hypothetical protein BZY88_09645 [SAR202 cluster bacterium Io17-Chloro-G9]|nr:MAG: hypothetical protein BZY88_09645 [SAR202 cluster bacterium Io17-Chloro-G9]